MESGSLYGVALCKESIEHGHRDVPAEGEYEKDKVGRLRGEAEMLQQQLVEVSEWLNKLSS